MDRGADCTYSYALATIIYMIRMRKESTEVNYEVENIKNYEKRWQEEE